MIQVRERPEPQEFDVTVGAPGRRWLAAFPEAQGAEAAPYWRDGMPLLRRAYKGICAYLCCWVWPGSGTGSTDHFVAKKLDRDLIYTWSNYRYTCTRMNSRKGVSECVDPFEVHDGWFELDFSGLPVVRPAADLDAELRELVLHTINGPLKLNSDECLEERLQYLEMYRSGLDFTFLVSRSPFIALELCRQGLLRADDSHYAPVDIRAWLDAD